MTTFPLSFARQADNLNLWVMGPELGEFIAGIRNSEGPPCVHDVTPRSKWLYASRASVWKSDDPTLQVKCFTPEGGRGGVSSCCRVTFFLCFYVYCWLTRPDISLVSSVLNRRTSSIIFTVTAVRSGTATDSFFFLHAPPPLDEIDSPVFGARKKTNKLPVESRKEDGGGGGRRGSGGGGRRRTTTTTTTTTTQRPTRPTRPPASESAVHGRCRTPCLHTHTHGQGGGY